MIPIKNVYYMLSYAFRILKEDRYKNVESEQFDNIYDLYSSILITGTNLLIKRGLSKDYNVEKELTSSPHGKIDISASIKTNKINEKKVICLYDDFNENIYLNKVLKSCFIFLLKKDISLDRKKKIKQILLFFKDVDTLDIKHLNKKISYNRNNKHYELLMSICYLLSKSLLLSNKDGNNELMAFIDDQSMHKLYEKFILEGSIQAGGYVWHTTGSGKTLTSFKTATLAKDLPFVDKVMFVVDRKDLDYQTIKEYDRFEKGCVSGNKSTAILKSQLENENTRIIVTTIQKLNVFIKQNKTHSIYSKNVVLIFDECHRSQFGESHKNIVKAFKKYFIFGFTGTPIFAENAVKTKNSLFMTTEQTFGDKLHTYTIIDAIRDENVLKFLVDRVRTMKSKSDIEDENVESIDQEGALLADERIEANTRYIINAFKRKTKDGAFNSILATQSIPMAMKYYKAFKNNANPYRVAIIYSFSENEDPDGIFMDDENSDDTSMLDATSRNFLDAAIRDYNQYYGTNFDTSGERFQNYYKDVSKRMKEKQIDILIVVNMFLTGFDAKTLNTLWVDKNLKYHGLLQAFSRTNRIYDKVKSYGNIVTFRNLDKKIEEAISLFGNEDAGGLVLLKDYDSYYKGFIDEKGIAHKGYEELAYYILQRFDSNTIPLTVEAQKDFINSFNSLLNIMNILSVFERFENEQIIEPFKFQDYMSIYVNLREKFRKEKKEKEKVDITDDIEFETELVKQFEINIDYILMLLEQYKSTGDKVILPTIKKLIASSFDLRSKKILIEAFIENIDSVDNVSEEWSRFIQKQAQLELDNIIEINNLKKEPTYDFMEFALKNEVIDFEGTKLDNIMPPISIFGGKAYKKELLAERLQEYFDKYRGLVYVLKGDNYC